MKRFSSLLSVLPLLLTLPVPLEAQAAPITYYDLDFEDGSFGGASVAAGFNAPTNIAASNLDGRALAFGSSSQLLWSRNASDAATHYVAFDYFANPGANLTQFLDTPSILRLDVSVPGRHRVEVYYDFLTQSVTSFLDGVEDPSLQSILAWSVIPSAVSIRIANTSGGTFEIDNLRWQGNVDLPRVAEPGVLALMGLGLLGAGLARRRCDRACR